MILDRTLDVFAATKKKESYQSYVDRVQRRLVRLVSRFEGGLSDITEFGNDFKDTLEEAYTEAFKRGKEAAGGGTISTKDHRFLRSLTKKQKKYVDGFIQDLNKGTSSVDVFERAKMYTGSVDHAFWTGNVRGQDKDTLYLWVTFPADHCEDCLRLQAGSPYKPADLPTVPRAGDTACRMNCKCKLVVVKRKKKR